MAAIKAHASQNPAVEHISIGALAKRQNELFLPGKYKSILLSTMHPETRNLLMHIRDEAHRFAITYYRKRHSMSMRP
jgi:excinuclease ABC subunit C